jgi:uncharacterized protein (TIGR02452 family)
MPDQFNRIKIAEQTLEIIKQGYYLNPNGSRIDLEQDITKSVQHSILYKADAFDPVFQARDGILVQSPAVKTVFEVTEETTLQAADRLSRQYDRVYCLNFASAKNPGGGFLGGAQAQEESLARSSALYPCIVQMTEMYAGNKRLKTCLYSDDMIYSPDVPIFRKDNGDLLDRYYKTSIITAPAVNAGVIHAQEPENIEKMDPVMLVRLEKILSIAVVKGYRVLLMGAWGCGVFRNDPNKVAAYFKHHLIDNERFSGCFDKVVFAIYGGRGTNENLPPFMEIFGNDK